MRVDICGFDSPEHNGGPLQWLMRMPEELRSRGLDCRVLLFGWAPPETCLASQYLTAKGFKVCFAQFADTFTNLRWLLQQCREDLPQVFYANHVIPAFYAAGYLKEAGIATVGALRSDDRYYHAIIEQFFARKSRFNPTAAACVSDFLNQAVTQKKTIKPEFCRTIPSGAVIPTQMCHPRTGSFHALYVGRLVHEQKRALDMVKALHRAKAETPELTAELIGDGDARSDIEAYLENEKIDWIVLRGAQSAEAIQAAMMRSHCLVLLSDYEGAPMAVMEAMACGLPPICLKMRSGIPDLIQNGATGLIVEDRENAFSRGIAQLAAVPLKWQAMSHAARESAERQFSISVCADKLHALFRDIAPSKPPTTQFSIPTRFHLPRPHPDFTIKDQRPPSWLQQKSRRFRQRLRSALRGNQSN